MQDYIRLQSGRKFRYHRPRTQDIHIDDIARNLSNLCRFTGATKRFYSIAEHCCHCADQAPQGHEFALLMHDAQEALCADINTILKRLLPQYKSMELRIEQLIARKYRLPFPNHPVVKEVDTRMLATEMKQLLPADDWKHLPFAPYKLSLPCWAPEQARREFLKRFRQLSS